MSTAAEKLSLHSITLFCLLAALPAVSHAQADAVRGELLYESRCGGCHSLDANRVGPMHRGVVGRTAGTVPGFQYSTALMKSRIVWTARALDRWLTNPATMVPGQKMGYMVSDPIDRADLIAYLARESRP